MHFKVVHFLRIFHKSSYGNVKMIVYFDIINLVKNYMVFNELKTPYDNKPFWVVLSLGGTTKNVTP
jgi:hypothetical protein